MKAGFTIGVVAICLIMCVVVNERVITIGKNVDDLHQARLDMHDTLYTSVVTNMDVHYGEIGFLLNTITEAEARLSMLTSNMVAFARLSHVNDKFIHDAMEEEMGYKDLKKFKKEWGNAQIQAK